jgi:hypothetical protein
MSPVTIATISANGTSSAVAGTVFGTERRHSDTWSLYLQGTLGGGSYQLQASADGTNFVNVGSPMTTAGVYQQTVFALQVRIVTTGATSPSAKVLAA